MGEKLKLILSVTACIGAVIRLAKNKSKIDKQLRGFLIFCCMAGYGVRL